ncbi:MAG: glutamine synthetase family protein [Afipia sp.]|nr:glutamine synthetase family protein [Afipia sp.]
MPDAFSFEALKTAVAAGEIDTVIVAMVDMAGQLIGKRFHAAHFVATAHDETHACNYLLANDIDMEPVPGYAAANWSKGYGDFVLKPDMATLRRIAWLPGTALVIADVLDHHSHEDVPHSPRGMLKKQLARLNAMGIKAYFATELEFYLFDESYEAIHAKGYRDPKTAGYYIEDYHIFQTTKEEPVMRAIRNGLHESGIPVENSKGEWGPGQAEINVRYADALDMADRHVVIKNGIKEIAHAQGKAVTFMSKWRYDLAGSSSHVHASLWDAKGETPLFADPNGERGMSELMRQYVAGQLAHAREITYFLAPYINSYKRFQQVGTFAPTRAVWSDDNRTAGFRLCGAGTKGIRIECRIGGSDLNPYLAFAALIAAGLSGIEQKLELEPAFVGDAYGGAELRQIPSTLREATQTLDGSAMLRAALGNDVVDHYVHTARWEQLEYDRRITDWELHRGFERY